MSLLNSFIAGFTGRSARAPKPKSPAPKPVKVVKPKEAPIPILQIGSDIFTGNPFTIDSRDFLSTGERDAILASSGMGKSYLMGVILEEILERSNQVVMIIDPDGEWHPLKKRYDIPGKKSLTIFGKKGHRKLPAITLPLMPTEEQVVAAKEAFSLIMTPVIRGLIASGASAIFDTSLMNDREQEIATAVICEAIFKGEHNLDDDSDDENIPECRKVRLFIDEAQAVCPQIVKGCQAYSLEAITKIAKRGRKRNIHLLVATQRPSSISKDVLSQCIRFWLGAITNKNDFKPNKEFYEAAGLTLTDVQQLEVGQFVYSAGRTKLTIKSRKRWCEHGGKTKKESAKPIASSEEVNAMLDKLL